MFRSVCSDNWQAKFCKSTTQSILSNRACSPKFNLAARSSRSNWTIFSSDLILLTWLFNEALSPQWISLISSNYEVNFSCTVSFWIISFIAAGARSASKKFKNTILLILQRMKVKQFKSCKESWILGIREHKFRNSRLWGLILLG